MTAPPGTPARPPRRWTWAGTLPTTNARIILTLVLAGLTGLLVIASGLTSAIVAVRTAGAVQVATWIPPTEWLTFLSVWAGIDVVQFGIKRFTHVPVEAAEGGPG